MTVPQELFEIGTGAGYMPDDDGIERRVLFVDFESSGLHKGSYPVEMAICGLDLQPRSFLIRPHATWTMDDWSIISEQVHGISRQQTEEEGVDIDDLMEVLQDGYRGIWLLSDNPGMDHFWFLRMATAAREMIYKPVFCDHMEYMGHLAVMHGRSIDFLVSLYDDAKAVYPRTHRAGPDALNHAAVAAGLILGHLPDPAGLIEARSR